jgi:hypothetical protein
VSVLLRDDLQTREQEPGPSLEYVGPVAPVNELVERLSEALDFLGEDGIAVHLALCCDRWAVVAVDRALIEGLLLGLSLRARDHMPQGGLLSLETSLVELDTHFSNQTGLPPGEYVRISVSDTGGWSGGATSAWTTRMGSSRRLERPSLAALRHAAEAGGGALVSARHACCGGRADLFLPIASRRSRPRLTVT